MNNIQAPSLASSAMLTELNISVWTGRKKDRRESKTVADQNYADSGVVSVNKMLRHVPDAVLREYIVENDDE